MGRESENVIQFPKRQRLRQVSAERIAKVVEELSKRNLPCTVQLSTDGSALLLTDQGATKLTSGRKAVNPWDEVYDE
jgi:hypothetical protein